MKRRTPETFEDAALEAAALMGPDHAGQVAGGITGAAVRAWSDPDKPANVPSVKQALAVDAACFAHPGGHGRMPFLHAYLHQVKTQTADIAPAVGDLLDELLDLPEAVGALTAAVRQARAAQSAGGERITQSEEHNVRASIKALRQELDDLELSLGLELEGGKS